MLRPLDKVLPFKIGSLESELDFSHCRHGSLQIRRGRDTQSDSSRRPIPRGDVSTSRECGGGRTFRDDPSAWKPTFFFGLRSGRLFFAWMTLSFSWMTWRECPALAW